MPVMFADIFFLAIYNGNLLLFHIVNDKIFYLNINDRCYFTFLIKCHFSDRAVGYTFQNYYSTMHCYVNICVTVLGF